MVVGPGADPMADLDKIQQERDALATRAEELRRMREEAKNGGAETPISKEQSPVSEAPIKTTRDLPNKKNEQARREHTGIAKTVRVVWGWVKLTVWAIYIVLTWTWSVITTHCSRTSRVILVAVISGLFAIMVITNMHNTHLNGLLCSQWAFRAVDPLSMCSRDNKQPMNIPHDSVAILDPINSVYTSQVQQHIRIMSANLYEVAEYIKIGKDKIDNIQKNRIFFPNGCDGDLLETLKSVVYQLDIAASDIENASLAALDILPATCLFIHDTLAGIMQQSIFSPWNRKSSKATYMTNIEVLLELYDEAVKRTTATINVLDEVQDHIWAAYALVHHEKDPAIEEKRKYGSPSFGPKEDRDKEIKIAWQETLSIAKGAKRILETQEGEFRILREKLGNLGTDPGGDVRLRTMRIMLIDIIDRHGKKIYREGSQRAIDVS